MREKDRPRLAASKFLRALLDSGARAGVAEEGVLEELGVERAVANDPRGWITVAQMARAWEIVPSRSGDPSFGLRAAAETPPGVYGALDLATMSSATVGEALSRMERYYRLLGAMSTLTLTRAPSGAGALRVEAFVPRAPLRHYVEHMFALVTTRIRLVTTSRGDDWTVTLRHAAPEDTREHARALGARVRFAARHDELVIGRETMSLPLRTASPALAALLEQEEARFAARADEPIDARVRGALAAGLREGDASLDGVARRLAMSPRSVQRGLADRGETFARVLEAVRREAAERHLEEGKLSLGEIAFVLGFSEASAFHRAFKRWTGRTPNEHALGAVRR